MQQVNHDNRRNQDKKIGDCINKMRKLQEHSSKFIKVRCSGCKNEQVIFGKPSSKVNCLVCNAILVEPTGGKGKIKTQILEVLE